MINKGEYNKKYYQEHKEERKAYHKKYYQEHKEERNSYFKKYRSKNKEKLKEYGKNRLLKNPNYYKKYKPSRKKASKEYSKKNPIKIKAHNKANCKIKIPKGQLCVDCDKKVATQKHHEDYNKPLEVEFLCNWCHTKRTIKEDTETQIKKSYKK